MCRREMKNFRRQNKYKKKWMGRKWHRVRWLLIIDPKVQLLWAGRKPGHREGRKEFLSYVAWGTDRDGVHSATKGETRLEAVQRIRYLNFRDRIRAQGTQRQQPTPRYGLHTKPTSVQLLNILRRFYATELRVLQPENVKRRSYSRDLDLDGKMVLIPILNK